MAISIFQVLHDTVLSRMNDIFHFLIKLWRFHSEYFSWWFSGTIHLDIWLCTQMFTLFFSLFCFQLIFWQMAFLIGWCKENGNFIRKKTSTGSKIWTYSFFWSKYPTKIESQCQRCYCLGQHTNTLYNFRHKSTNITWFFGVFGTILSKWWNSLLLGSKLWHHCGWVTILVGYIVPQHG